MIKQIYGQISTDIFYKETDSKKYLNFYSCHPKHTKVNISFNLAKRIKTIVSDDNLLQTRIHELKKSLIERGYQKSIIKNGIKKAMLIPRNSLLTPKIIEKQNIVPYISTNNPKNKEVFGILKNNLEILKQDSKMNSVLKNTKIIKCKRQPKNLKQLLTSSEFTTKKHKY